MKVQIPGIISSPGPCLSMKLGRQSVRVDTKIASARSPSAWIPEPLCLAGARMRFLEKSGCSSLGVSPSGLATLMPREPCRTCNVASSNREMTYSESDLRCVAMR